MELNSARNVLQESGAMKVALIATYPEMSRILQELVQGTKIEILDIYASFADAAEKAKAIEHDVDAILTRGGTGYQVKQSVSIPVISIPISPFDLFVSVSNLSEKYHCIAFANFERAIFGAKEISTLCKREIRQYQFTDKSDLYQLVLNARNDGCDLFIGGAEGVSIAQDIGLDAKEISSGREAIYQALKETIGVVHTRRIESQRAVRLESAFNALSEGICVANDLGTVSVFNPAAKKIFGLPADASLIGENILNTPVSASVINHFDAFTPQTDVLEHIRNHVVSTNHIPIYMEHTFIGTVSTFQDVSRIQLLEGQIRRHLSQQGFVAKYTFEDILTKNHSMRITKELAKLYAQTDSAILILGESGTGKELFAHSIHNASKRAIGPFVTVNCAAIPEQLLESELFGYSSGAFTGAKKEGKAGLFEMAHNGTIFLDEIGEMPKHLQSRLLRVLQEKEVMRLGDNKVTSVNCRIISATNKNLENLVLQGNFREDLYYRLATFSINIPPLRERRDDISLLCLKFLSSLTDVPGRILPLLTTQLEKMSDYHWPGNIRELQSVCARISLLQAIQSDKDIQPYIKIAMQQDAITTQNTVTFHLDSNLSLKDMEEEAAQQYVTAVLKKNGNNHSKTAKQLGIGRTTLWRYLNSISGGEEV